MSPPWIAHLAVGYSFIANYALQLFASLILRASPFFPGHSPVVAVSSITVSRGMVQQIRCRYHLLRPMKCLFIKVIVIATNVPAQKADTHFFVTT